MPNRTAFAHAREDRRLRAFMAGVAAGFASWPAVIGDEVFSPRRYRSQGRQGDMKRIGGDMRTAFYIYDDTLGNRVAAER